ncbi:MAG: hypothetical protein ABMA26_27285 [Limisphaerales bacterium]
MNKHGLSRDIPDPVMREVRQRCGFGCVMCGCAIIQYHHFAPEYSEAQAHLPKGITILCGTCHDRVTRGILGNDQIAEYDANPYCKREGFVEDMLFMSRDKIHFQIGSATFRRHAVLLYDDEVLIGFAGPSEGQEPLRLFAKLTDEDGGALLTIQDNVWRAGVEHFDVQTEGKELTIRRKLRDVVLRMVLNPGGEIVLERLKMAYQGFQITVEEGRLNVRNPNGGRLVLCCPNIHSTMRLTSKGAVTV